MNQMAANVIWAEIWAEINRIPEHEHILIYLNESEQKLGRN